MDIINTIITIAAVIVLCFGKINININYNKPEHTEEESSYKLVQQELDEQYEAEQKEFVDTATAIQNIFTEEPIKKD